MPRDSEFLPSIIHSASHWNLPTLITNAGDRAVNRFLEFFAASIRNPGTRAAYSNAVSKFSRFCELHGVALEQVTPIVVATFIERSRREVSDPTVKVYLSAIRMMFDYLVTGHVVVINPAASVRGPKHIVKKGKTPVLTGPETRQLLDSINIDTIIGLRDRALIGVLVYSFARITAALGMNVEDYFTQGGRRWFRLHEKGGKHHEVPAHRKAEEMLDAYLLASGIRERKVGMFRTVDGGGRITEERLSRTDALRMIKRRAVQAGLRQEICCHTFRATGITVYLENGGSLEHAQRIAAHESARTTKLYDRTGDAIKVDELERIAL